MKVGVCLVSGGMVHSSFAVCLASLVGTSLVNGVSLTIVNVESSCVAANRDNAVAQARAADCTHVLFLDSDMVFPADALLRLLDREKDFVGALYARRVAPFATLGRLAEPGEGARDGELREALDMGMGCALIRTSVFDELEAPYFRFVALPAADKLPAEVAGMDLSHVTDFPTTLGEDYYLCAAARRAGVKLWADTALSVEIGHTGNVTQYVPRGIDGGMR
jgi:hypothetical protein